MRIVLTLFLLAAFSKTALAGIFYPISQLHPSEKQVEKRVTPQQVLQKFPKFYLEGIVSGNQPIAIVNGKYLRVGDKLSGCRVNKIDAVNSSILLRCKTINVQLKLDLLKNSAEEKIE